MFKKIKSNGIIYLIIAFIVIIFPSLFMDWSLVDDGKSAQVAYELTESVKGLDFVRFAENLLEPESGRFRPFYWVYLWITFLVGGNNIVFHYLVHMLVCLATCVLIYKFANFGRLKKAGVLATLFFILDWRLLENWYRLGPQEPVQLLVLLGSLFFFLAGRKIRNKKQIYYSYLLLIVGFLYKETSVAYVAVPLYLLLTDLVVRNKRHLRSNFTYLLLSLAFSLITRVYPSYLYSGSGYAALYQVDASMIIDNLKNYLFMLRSAYSPLFEVILSVFILRYLYYFKMNGLKKALSKFYFQGLWLVWFMAFFVVQLPWGFTIGRYLQLAMVGLFILVAIEVQEASNYLIEIMADRRVRERLDVYWIFGGLKAVLFFLLALVVGYQLVMSLNYIQSVQKVSEFNRSFIYRTVESVPMGGRAYLNANYLENPPLELYKEIDWHFDYLHNRSDIEYDYLPIDYDPNEGDVLLLHTAEPLFTADELREEVQLERVDSKSTTVRFVVLNSPLGFIKQLPKIVLDISRESQSNKKLLDNFFAMSEYTYSWEIYRVIK